ncbi:MAG: hypothetical protein Q4A47_06345 [Erysipelotrichaceae bacterium]|nr:hypothetical protein [Erysipelotrichaceae bacterium]
MINVIFLIICFLVDALLGIIFKNDFALRSFTFIPSGFFLSFMLVVKEKNLFETIIFTFLCGMFMDLIHGDHFLLYALLCLLCGIIYHLWAKHLSESIFEQILILEVILFVKEILLFMYFSISKLIDLSFVNFIESRLFITLLGNIIVILVLIFANHIRKYLNYDLERKKRRNEDLFGTQFK